MFRFFVIERPTTRPCGRSRTATSIACCIRWMFEANGRRGSAPVRVAEISCERLADEPLGAGHPGPLGVRRVAEQEVDALGCRARRAADVGLQPVDGRVVELPVAGVDDPAGGGVEHDRDGVRDRVGDAHELEPERADLDRLALRLGLAQLVVAAVRPCSSSFDLISAERQLRRRSPGRTSTSRSRYGSAADVVLVPVREHDRAQSRALAQVREVGQDEVDAEVLVAREREAGVDDDDLVAELVDGHVLADLAEAAERDDATTSRGGVYARP